MGEIVVLVAENLFMRRFWESKTGTYMLFTVLTVLPVLVFVLPKTFFDDGPPLCIYTALAGTECPGCGLTRGTMRLSHFDFAGAWELNKLTFIVVPLLAIWWIKQWIVVFKKVKTSQQKTSANT
jgi:hypothetical protein